MKVGIQGERGSACDAAGSEFATLHLSNARFEYFPTAVRTLAALDAQLIEAAVLAVESPVGVAVSETSSALLSHPAAELSELRMEVRHCIMVRHGAPSTIRKVASHPIPLQKHKRFLLERFPGYEPVEVEDTGLAARLLSEGKFSCDTAVIAMPHAAEIFDLKITDLDLPANSGYLTKFALVKKPLPALSEIKLLAEHGSAGVPNYQQLDHALVGESQDSAELFYEDDAKENRYLTEVQRFVPNYQEMTAKIVRLAVRASPRMVLDAGLGPGNLALQILRQTDARLVGIDSSKEMVQWAATVLLPFESRVQLIVDDLSSALLPERSDVVITNLVLHNLADEEKMRLLGKLFGCLAPQGLLLWGDTVRAELREQQDLTDWFRWKWALEHGASTGHIMRTFRKERRMDNPWTIARMGRALEAQGFEGVSTEYAELGMAVLGARKP